MSSHQSPFEVAIVGGGIAGLALAIGLLKRNVSFKIYERAHGFREVGAGIGFTPNAERAMKALDPAIHAAFRTVATQNNDDIFNYVDGSSEESILKLYLGERGFEGCRRPDFLEELVRHIPEDNVVFGKELVDVIDKGDGKKLQLVFRDGTSAEADTVIGCDGIRSKVRRIMLGDSHPAAHPSYSHKYAIRGLIPMEKAREALGEWRTSTRLMHLGPKAHALTFPVAHGKLLNVVAFVTDPNEWKTEDSKLTAPATRDEAIRAFSAFSPAVRTIMELLPEQVDRWAVFDTYNHPVPSYVSGRLCLVADSAHGSAPHHGAGAGCGIEDCLVLAVLLDSVAKQPGASSPRSLQVALQVYNNSRYERSQWIVQSSRIIGDVYEFMDPECAGDHNKIASAIYSRSHKIWDYDVDAMVKDATEQFNRQILPFASSSSPIDKRFDLEQRKTVEAITEKDTSSTDISSDASVTPPMKYLSGFPLAAIMVSFTVVYFLMMLDMSILSTAIPYITDDFNSLLDVGWYGSAYQLVCAAIQPLTGKMYARLNSKVLFLCFFTVFELGSAICGAAQSSVMLIIGRAVAGIGGAGLAVGGFTIVNSCVEPARRPGMLGFMMAFGNLGAAAGPLIGGAITEYASWNWCFYINLPAGALLLPCLVFVAIPDHIQKPPWKTVIRNPLTEFDLIGFALFTPAAVQFFLALQFAGSRFPWKSAEVIGLFCGAVVMFAIFCAWNKHKGDAAMIPFSTLKIRLVWTSCVTILLLAGTVFVTAYYLPLYFQGVRDRTPFQSGVDLLPTILSQVVFTLAGGRLVQRLGYYLPFVIAGGAFNTIGSGLLTLITPRTTTAALVGFQILSGTGRGLALPMPMIAIQNVLSPAQIPMAMSTFVFSQNFGGALFTALAQTIFANSLKSTLRNQTPALDADAIIAAGSTKMRDIVDVAQRAGLLDAYSESLSRTFWLVMGMALVSLAVSLGMGWKDVRPKVNPAHEGNGNRGSSSGEDPKVPHDAAG